MGVAHVGLVHRDPCECKIKGFRAVSSIERIVSKRRHLRGVRHRATLAACDYVYARPCHSMETQVDPSSALKRTKHHQSDPSNVPGILGSS